MPSAEHLRQSCAYAGLKKEEYESIKATIDLKNRQTLTNSSLLATILLAVMTGLTFLLPALASNRRLYFCTMLVMLALHLCSRTAAARGKMSLPLSYAFLFAAFGFAIILGTVIQTEMSATTFCVLIFALPLLLIDKPYRITLFLLGITVLFCISTTLHKAPRYAGMDRLNSISFLFLSIAVNYYFLQTKMRDVLQRNHIEHQRDTDDLTKLMTKAAAERSISAYMAECKEPAALLVIDVDNFKSVNDTMGHAYGDAVLRIMGECVRKVFRSSDYLARFGGDEFVLFLHHVSRPDIVKDRVEALVQQMQTQLAAPESAYSVTGSIGIAFYPDDATDYATLFAKADKALYVSKGQGKNCYTFYVDRNAAMQMEAEPEKD